MKNTYKKLLIIICFIITTLLLVGFKENNRLLANNNYVLNKRTKKIHIESCSAITNMSSNNRIDVNDTLLNLYRQKYVVCKKCRAGIAKNLIESFVDENLHPNLYLDDMKNIPTIKQYINSIDKTGEWYVTHIPTYASKLQKESINDYKGEDSNYKEYNIDGYTYNVITSNKNDKNIKDLNKDAEILCGDERAVNNYINKLDEITFKERIAYYPCELINNSLDYNMAGDDCVRYIFTIFNAMDSSFTGNYSMYSNKKFSNTNSNMFSRDTQNVAYAMTNLGFEIYDEKERVIDVNVDGIPDGYISQITSDFKLQKGDILARDGHIHMYLDDGIVIEALNFGWGRVYRKYPQKYVIKVSEKNNKNYDVVLVNGSNKVEHYNRVYRYVGMNGGK